MNALERFASQMMDYISIGREDYATKALQDFVRISRMKSYLLESKNLNQIGSVYIVAAENEYLNTKAFLLAYWCFSEEIKKNPQVRLSTDNRLDLLENSRNEIKSCLMPILRNSQRFNNTLNLVKNHYQGFQMNDDFTELMEISDFSTENYDLQDEYRENRRNALYKKIKEQQYWTNDLSLIVTVGKMLHLLIHAEIDIYFIENNTGQLPLDNN